MGRHFSLDDSNTQKVPGVVECSPPPLPWVLEAYCAQREAWDGSEVEKARGGS